MLHFHFHLFDGLLNRKNEHVILLDRLSLSNNHNCFIRCRVHLLHRVFGTMGLGFSQTEPQGILEKQLQNEFRFNINHAPY